MPPIGTSQAADQLGSEAAPSRPRAADDLIFDIGLDRGDDAAFYLALGYDVIGFEVDPVNVEYCRARFAREIADRRVTIIHGAATDLGATIGAHGVPHFMKVGIREKARLCLESLAAASGRPRFVSIESSAKSTPELIAEFDLLEALGYERFSVVERAKVGGQIVRTSDRSGRPLEYRFKVGTSGPFGGDLSPWLKREHALTSQRKTSRSALRILPRLAGREPAGAFDIHAMLASS